MFDWLRRKSSSAKPVAEVLLQASGSRIAVGDLLVDLELPVSWRRNYEESGALAAWEEGKRFVVRISGITITGKNVAARDLGVRHLAEDAVKKGKSITKISDSLAYYSETSAGEWDEGPSVNEFWIVGFGNRRLVLTLSFLEANQPAIDLPAVRAAVEHAIRSVRPTYPDVSRDEKKPKIFDLVDSQRLWFDYHRADMRDRVRKELGYECDGLIPLDVLDEFWARFIAAPPDSNDAVNAILNGVGVMFGDHLVQEKKFEWIILSDSYGVCLAIVALRGSANLNSDPMNFVAKRWDSKESKFIVACFKAICDLVDETAAKWRL